LERIHIAVEFYHMGMLMHEFFSAAWSAVPYTASVAMLPTCAYFFYFILSPPEGAIGKIVGTFAGIGVFLSTCLYLSVFPILWHYFGNRIGSLLLSPFTGFGFVLAAAILYWFRGKMPKSYGLFEIYSGLAIIAVVTHQSPVLLGVRLVSLLSATYIIIDGLDNISRGLSPEGRSLWKLIFPVKI
jgi:hypothetical protein